MESGEQQTDIQLFLKICDGDQEAFRCIFDRYKRIIYNAALKWTKSTDAAEDITQEVFIKLWNSRSLLKNVNNPRSYLYKIAFNKTKNLIRDESLRSTMNNNIAVSYTASNNVQDNMDLLEIEQLINNALNHLSKQKQIIFALSKNYHKSYKEIADELKISPETVRSHLYETRKYIRFYIKSAMLLTLILFIVI